MSGKIAFEIQRRLNLVEPSLVPYAVTAPFPVSGRPRQIDTAKGLWLYLTDGLDEFE